jgi:hypothetical protein
VDRIEAVTRGWPRLFTNAPVGMAPLTIDDDTLIVMCQSPNLVAHVTERERELVAALNAALDRRDQIRAVRAVQATATEMYLARELLALRIWLRDFDIGF